MTDDAPTTAAHPAQTYHDADLPLHLMLDIETLDTQPSALVLSAGWAWFNENRVISSGVVSFDHHLQQRTGRTTSIDTVRWWKEQAEPLPDSRHGFDVRMLDGELWRTNPRRWANTPSAEGMEDVLVWANSPSFDCVILRHWAASLQRNVPWAFWMERDFRTHKYLVECAYACSDPETTPLHARAAVQHSAEQDARDQAQFMIDNKHLVRF